MISSLLTVISEITIQASILIAVVMLIRLLLEKKLDKRLQYYLWIPVALRLLLPFSIESELSLLNLFAPATDNDVSKIVISNDTLVKEVAISHAGEVSHVVRALSVTDVLLLVWIAGVAVVGIFTLVNNLRFTFKLKKGRRLFASELSKVLCDSGINKDLLDILELEQMPAIYVSDNASSPCAVGIISPSIYLPTWVMDTPEDLRYILIHELTHIKHHDNLFAFFLSLCCTIYWFNPLVWVMGCSARFDRELACDAQVTRDMSIEEKREYGMVLIAALRKQSIRYRYSFVSPMANKKKEMNRRLYLIGRPQTYSSVIAVLVLLVMASALLTAGTSAVKTSPEKYVNNLKEAKVHFDYESTYLTRQERFKYTPPVEEPEIIPTSALLTAENLDQYTTYTQMSVNDPDTLQELNSLLKTDNCLFRINEDSVSKEADNALYVKLQDGQDPGNDRYCRVLYSAKTHAVYLSDNYSKRNTSYQRMSYSDSDRFMDIMSKLSQNAPTI
ncbi:MAG: hypothetical protein J5778_00820 [Clostridiales bacterium]|nr:hypothetical protein [Clostridiales bacterium]